VNQIESDCFSLSHNALLRRSIPQQQVTHLYLWRARSRSRPVVSCSDASQYVSATRADLGVITPDDVSLIALHGIFVPIEKVD